MGDPKKNRPKIWTGKATVTVVSGKHCPHSQCFSCQAPDNRKDAEQRGDNTVQTARTLSAIRVGRPMWWVTWSM